MNSKNHQPNVIKNIISIDPSLSCTALIVNDKKFAYIEKKLANGKKDLRTWFKICEPLVSYRFHSNSFSSIYTESENEKIELYNEIVNNIINDIIQNIIPDVDIIIGIEGYSQSSKSGPIIDLVTFGTLLRNKLKQTFDCQLTILAPTVLKLEAAKLTYEPIEKGKKIKTYEWRNNIGIAGGKFTKTEMYDVLTDNKLLTCEWVEFLRSIHDRISLLTNIPKPIEDINDAKILYEILKKKY